MKAEEQQVQQALTIEDLRTKVVGTLSELRLHPQIVERIVGLYMGSAIFGMHDGLSPGKLCADLVGHYGNMRYRLPDKSCVALVTLTQSYIKLQQRAIEFEPNPVSCLVEDI